MNNPSARLRTAASAERVRSYASPMNTRRRLTQLVPDAERHGDYDARDAELDEQFFSVERIERLILERRVGQETVDRVEGEQGIGQEMQALPQATIQRSLLLPEDRCRDHEQQEPERAGA